MDELRPGVARAHGALWNLWVRADGRSPRQLTHLDEDGLDAAWSPEGARIAFVTDIGLYAIGMGGEELERVELRADPRGLDWLRPRAIPAVQEPLDRVEGWL